MSIDAAQLHKESIVIDATCPLLGHEDSFEMWLAGGATAACATVGLGQPEIGKTSVSVRMMGGWLKRIRQNPDKLLLVKSTEDIRRAKAQGKLGIIFHFQGSMPIEDEVNTMEPFHEMGLRVLQLCYNTEDLVGCGSAVAEDKGLTDYGKAVIAEANELGIVVDCAHTGYQTTRQAIDASADPVIVSHSNARAVFDNARNLPDDIIRSVAANGGVIGVNGFPGFVAAKSKPTLDDLLDHVDYIANLVGTDVVCLGIDYFEYQAGVVDDATAKVIYDYLIDSGAWSTDEYPTPPWHYPHGIEMPDKLPNLTAGLVKRGYSEQDIQAILGLNLMRVYDQVWK